MGQLTTIGLSQLSINSTDDILSQLNCFDDMECTGRYFVISFQTQINKNFQVFDAIEGT